MARVGGDRPQRLGHRPEQDGIDHRLVLEGDGRHLVLEGDGRRLGRHGEHDMEVRDRQQIGLSVGQPIGPRQALALRAMAVAAGVVGDAAVRAVLASFNMSTECRGAAGFDRLHDATFNTSHMGAMSSPVGSAMAAENVRHLQGRTHGRALRRAAPPPRPGGRAGSGSWQWWSSPPACSAPSSTGCCGPTAPG